MVLFGLDLPILGMDLGFSCLACSWGWGFQLTCASERGFFALTIQTRVPHVDKVCGAEAREFLLWGTRHRPLMTLGRMILLKWSGQRRRMMLRLGRCTGRAFMHSMKA